jgi:serine/threonine-protein kinase RsbW
LKKRVIVVTEEQARSVAVHIPSELGYEKVAMEAAAAAAKRMGFSPDRIHDLRTAVSEACINAIEHGNQADVSTRVAVVMTLEPERLEVNVADEGRQPFPSTAPEPGRPDDHRGWGMFLIRHLMDEVEFSTEPQGGNQVKMVIYLDQPRYEGDAHA